MLKIPDGGISEIRKEDLPEIYREIFDVFMKVVPEAEAITIVDRFADMFGGQQIYFGKKEHLLRMLRDRAIREEFNGGNIRELAKKYKLTAAQIRVIVSKKVNKKLLNHEEHEGHEGKKEKIDTEARKYGGTEENQ